MYGYMHMYLHMYIYVHICMSGFCRGPLEAQKVPQPPGSRKRRPAVALWARPRSSRLQVSKIRGLVGVRITRVIVDLGLGLY